MRAKYSCVYLRCCELTSIEQVMPRDSRELEFLSKALFADINAENSSSMQRIATVRSRAACVGVTLCGKAQLAITNLLHRSLATSAIPGPQTCQSLRPFEFGNKPSERLFDVCDERPCFFGDGHEVIGAGEDGKLEFLLECFHLSTDVRLVDVKSFRCLSEVQLARNSEEVFELSERGDNGHKLTTRMKCSEPQISLH